VVSIENDPHVKYNISYSSTSAIVLGNLFDKLPLVDAVVSVQQRGLGNCGRNYKSSLPFSMPISRGLQSIEVISGHILAVSILLVRILGVGSVLQTLMYEVE
jgi:hypothetical protein